MQQPRLAGRYAKSLVDLAVEQNQLEAVYKDMQYLKAVCRQSKEFTALLKSPIIQSDKKRQIVEAVTTGKISKMTEGFNRLLVQKGRESVLPEIVHAFIDQYNEIKGIHKVKITTAVEVSDALKQEIVSKIKAETALQTIELETAVKNELIGGYTLEFHNNLVDASILRDLNDIRKQFLSNVYVRNIR
ncbi:MAG: ATP synthase F1 subunit delta [Sphingobacteriales bacterium]|nr:ATP synthase F1 subunit delta [Sphingobacteriales bacterium]